MDKKYGIYAYVKPTDPEQRMKDGHLLYSGKCTVCGKTIIKRELAFRKNNKRCHHLFTPSGIADKRIRRIFRGMKRRCYAENDDDYRFYGAKGVHICDEWLEQPRLFEEWSLTHGYQDYLTIDRIRDDGDYEPSNCEWVTLVDNAKYKSTTNLLSVRGEEHTGREWSLICGLGLNTINTYLRSYDAQDVQEFIEYTINNELPDRKHNNDSYIESYFANKGLTESAVFTYASVAQEEEHLS